MRVVDLFAGCGGLSLGFQKAGYDVVAAFELWSTAIECYKENFNHPVIQLDLSETNNAICQIKKFSPDMIIGGPPCQDFSHAGKRIEHDRAELKAEANAIYAELEPGSVLKKKSSFRITSHGVKRADYSTFGCPLPHIIK